MAVLHQNVCLLSCILEVIYATDMFLLTVVKITMYTNFTQREKNIDEEKI